MFVPEDGTGLPDANSFVSVEYADTFFKLRDQGWGKLSLEIKQQSLVLASDYVMSKWESSDFKGEEVKPGEQGLCFPRESTSGLTDYPFKPMPNELLFAVCWYAKIVSTQKQLAYPVLNTGNGRVIMEQDGVGPLAEKKQYSSGARDLWSVYPEADAKIAKLLATRRGFQGRLFR